VLGCGLTFRDGLLSSAPSSSSFNNLLVAPPLAGVIGEGKPFSLFLPSGGNLVTLFCGLGISTASLLGAGVKLALDTSLFSLGVVFSAGVGKDSNTPLEMPLTFEVWLWEGPPFF